MTNQKVLRISFGPLQPAIAEQLAAQGLTANHTALERWEKCRTAINLLFFADLLNDAERRRADERLMRKMQREVKERE